MPARPRFLRGKLPSSSVLKLRRYHSSFNTDLTLSLPSFPPMLPSFLQSCWCLSIRERIVLRAQTLGCINNALNLNLMLPKRRIHRFVFTCNPFSTDQLKTWSWVIKSHNYVLNNLQKWIYVIILSFNWSVEILNGNRLAMQGFFLMLVNVWPWF